MAPRNWMRRIEGKPRVRLTECCQFKLTGLTAYLTKGEALVAARRSERADGQSCRLETVDVELGGGGPRKLPAAVAAAIADVA